jgi:hypothetical protein
MKKGDSPKPAALSFIRGYPRSILGLESQPQ